MSAIDRLRAWMQRPLREPRISGQYPPVRNPGPPPVEGAPRRNQVPPKPAPPRPPRQVAEPAVEAADPLSASPVRMDRIRLQLELHEGIRTRQYIDTEGHPTIGIGRNLDAKPFDQRERAVIGDRDLVRIGLTAGEIGMLFRRDVADAIAQLDRHLPWWRTLDEVRRRVLVDMMFNMGPGAPNAGGLLSFRNTLEHIKSGRYQAAADGMAASKWARQTKTRADRLIRMMRTGEDWTS